MVKVSKPGARIRGYEKADGNRATSGTRSGLGIEIVEPRLPITSPPKKYIIRTTDRGLFKRCRQEWDFGSKIRYWRQPATTPAPLEFGTAIHGAMEVLYDPDTWHRPSHVQEALALQHFISINRTQLEHNPYNSEVDIIEEYSERATLGQGMLANYYKFYREHDRGPNGIKPIAVEYDFEIPVVDPTGKPLYVRWDVRQGRAEGFTTLNLSIPGFSLTIPVVYQGRIDLIAEDRVSNVWVWDHKTTAQMREMLHHLEVDTQVTSYGLAVYAQFGQCHGVVYNQILKNFPSEPKRNKNGSLSVDKTQGTTAELYLKAIGMSVSTFKEEGTTGVQKYDDFVNWLLYEDETQYVRRISLHRSMTELRTQAEYIYKEAIEMVGADNADGQPSIYPNPHEMNCNGCAYKVPCLQRIEGSDWQSALFDEDWFTDGSNRDAYLELVRKRTDKELN